MSSACSNAGLKMLTPLFDRFVNDRLLELFPLFDQAWLQLIRGSRIQLW